MHACFAYLGHLPRRLGRWVGRSVGSTGASRFAPMALLCLLAGCDSLTVRDTETVRAALPVVERAFGSAPANDREPLFTPSAWTVWRGLESGGAGASGDSGGTVRLTAVSDLRWVSDAQRAVVVDLEWARWPLAVRADLTLDPVTDWRVTAVDSDGVLRRHLESLGPHGLPRAGAARPWMGGLAGRDGASRPTAAILVLVTDVGVEIDGGRPAPVEAEVVIRGLRAAVARREALAAAAHATARIQAAFALPRETPSGLLPKLCVWGRSAGVREQLLLVRGADGGPAVLALPALDDVARAPAPPPAPTCAAAGAAAGAAAVNAAPRTCDPAWAPYLVLSSTAAGYTLEAAGESLVLGDLVDASVPEHLGPAVSRLRNAHPGLVGLRFRTGPGVSHGQVVGFLDAARIAAPDLPVLPEFEESSP